MAKILLIEDDSQLVKLYQDVFVDAGFKVLTATTGKKGLEYARSENPDLILLDIMLPNGMNGFDVLEQLEKDGKLKRIPVFVLTNLDSEEKVAKEIGAADYIIKAHVDPSEVVERVKKVLK